MRHGEPWKIKATVLLASVFFSLMLSQLSYFDTMNQGKPPLLSLLAIVSIIWNLANIVGRAFMEGKAHRLLGDSQLSSVIKGFSAPWCLSKAHAVLQFPSLLAKWGVPR